MRLNHRTRGNGVAFVAVLFLITLFAGGAAGVVPATAPIPAGLPPLAHPASVPNGNVSLYIPQPAAELVPGSYLVSQVRLTLLSNFSGLPPVITIWVPQMTALFYLVNQTVKVIGPTPTVNFTEGGPATAAIINATTVVTVEASFNGTALALLTSQLLAFMSSAPDGRVTLSASWRWAIYYPDGSGLIGPWSSPFVLYPGEYGRLVSYGPTTITTNGWFQVCMASTGVTREYSLHLETVYPVVDFIHADQNVTGNATEPVCWSAQVASWVTPQPLLAHVWAYDNLTYLLYLIRINVVNQTGPYGFLAPWTTWSSLVTLGALGVGAGVVVWGTVRFVSARRVSRSSDRTEQPAPEEKT